MSNDRIQILNPAQQQAWEALWRRLLLPGKNPPVVPEEKVARITDERAVEETQ